MRGLLVLIGFVFITASTVFAQLEAPYYVKTVNYTTKKKEPGATVKLYEGSTLIQTLTTDNSGEVKLMLKAKKKYKIEVSKPGKVSRSVLVNLLNVDDELLQGNSSVKGAVEISLFDEQPGVDYSYVTSNPITEFYFDGSNTELQYDTVLADKMIKKIEKIMKDADSKGKENEANYNAIMKQAEGLYASKKYEEALVQYENAIKIKPAEKLPNDRIIEIDGILKATKNANLANAQVEEDYKNLISAADALRDQKKYDEAIKRYNEALTKKQEQYPKDQIAKCNTLIETAKKEAENKDKYDAAIKAADGFFAQKSWMAARDNYKTALKFKSDDPYSTGRLAEIETKLNAQKADQDRKKKYEDAVAAADVLFNEEKFVEAKAKYNEALTFEPAATYPKDKIKAMEAKLAEIEKENAKKAQIEKLLADGSKAFVAKTYPESKTAFTEVLKLDPENALAKAKIIEIDAKIAEEKANSEKIAAAKKLVTEGDALVKTNKNPEAKEKYEASLKLQPDPAVQAKIDAIDAKLADEGKKAEQKAKFDAAIVAGDAALAANNFDGAKSKYEEAAGIDAISTVPKTKLADVEKKRALAELDAQKAEKKAAFDKKMAEADASLTAKNYDVAITQYEEAAKIDPVATSPKIKIAEIQKLKADQANAAKVAEQKAKFDEALKAADASFAAKDLENAKLKYDEAAKIDPTSTVPKAKLAEIEKIKLEQANATKLAEQKAKFDEAIKAGDAALASKDLTTARAKYEEAAKLDATSMVPKTKIAEIEKIKAEQAEAAKLAEQKAKFEDAMKAGDEAMAANDLTNAKKKYIDATNLDPTSALPKAKLAEIEKKISDASSAAQKEEQKAKFAAAMKAGDDLFAAGKLTEAKTKYSEAQGIDASQAAPAEKIKAIEAALASADKEKQITQLLTDGNAAFGKKDLTTAKLKFQNVLTLDGTNKAAQDKLSEISKLENDAASEAEKNAKFTELKAEGNTLFKAADYAGAKQKYIAAKNIKSDSETDGLIAQCDAKIAELAKSQGAEQQYNNLMAEGQTLENSSKYSEALAKYTSAQALKNTPEVKERIAAINTAKANSDKQAKLDADYKDALKRGDDLVASAKYADAIKEYDIAASLKPSEALPLDKIAAAKKLSEKETAGTEDAAYQKILDVGQKAIDEKNYTKAKEMYNRAITFRSNDPFPKQKLAEIDKMIADEKASSDKLAAYQKKIIEAESLATAKKYQDAIKAFEQAKAIKSDELTPDTRIAELNALLASSDKTSEIDQKYKDAISKGGTFLSSKDYPKALEAYNVALGFKPGDKVAQDKISEINQLLDDQKNVEANKIKVAAFIAEGDKLFAKSDWSQAKAQYENALALDGGNVYAIKKVGECDDKMKNEDSVSKEYDKVVKAADKSFNSTDYTRAKELYTRAVGFRPNDAYPKKKLAEIDAILNPKVAPPVVSTNTGDPDPLKALGNPTDNSITEAQQKLVQAQIARKGRRQNRFSEKNKEIADKNGDLANKQEGKTTENVETLSEVKTDNNANDVKADEKRQENVVILKSTDKSIEETQNEAMIVQTATVQDQKAKINNVTVDAETASKELNAHTDENDKILKEGSTNLNEYQTDQQSNNYEKSIENNVVSTMVKGQIEEAQAIDDKRAPENKEVLLNYEQNTLDKAKVDETNQRQNQINFTESFKETENKQITYGDNKEEVIKNNEQVIKDSKTLVTEKERGDYNENYVKSVQNKTIIVNSNLDQEKYAELPSAVGENNAIKYDQIKTDQVNNADKASAKTVQKGVDNQNTLNNTKETVTKNTAVNTERPTNNATTLKTTQDGLGDQAVKQQESQSDKSLEAKKQLTEIANKENVVDAKGPNDLGKLYPEGVSQEQFDQLGQDGLVDAVVTRRVVVKDGHGDEYVRTQTVYGITYAKNGQPTTEITWQRETQNALLKRNY